MPGYIFSGRYQAAATQNTQRRCYPLTEDTGSCRLPTRSQRRPVFNRGAIAETGQIPDGFQFLQDTYSWKVLDTKKTMLEYRQGGKTVTEPIMRVTGLFQESDTQNANGRVYPRLVLSEAVSLIQDDVGRRAVYGEYDHPPDAKIHLDRISHLITKIWMEGQKIYGEAEVLDNQPHGRCLRGLFERKCQVGISSRGIGDMELREMSEGKQFYEVMPGYQFVTWDAVAEPSVHGATLAVMESLNRKLAPIKTANGKKPFSRDEYESLLIEEINRFFGLSDIGPRRQRRFGIRLRNR
jgi:hypothetical protein